MALQLEHARLLDVENRLDQLITLFSQRQRPRDLAPYMQQSGPSQLSMSPHKER